VAIMLAVAVPGRPETTISKKVDGKARPKSFTNGIGMKFVWVPAGSFLMGSPEEEKLRRSDETQHKVTPIRKLPVEKVSWDDCQLFAKKLRQRDGKPYRLPTEAEFEYACRAGTTTPFYCGETIGTHQANYNGEVVYGKGKRGVYRKKTTPVGSFPPNPWGLYDMHGNVWAWCQDRYGDYPRQHVIDPRGPGKGELRVLRGGSWRFLPQNCRSARRYWDEPDLRGIGIGCRLCF
jgi:formylglycine-generating enzyme required for sulfatase activity